MFVLSVAMWALSPPTEAIGATGWIPATAVSLGIGVAAYLLRSGRVQSWDGMLAIAYSTVVGIGVLQWLAGGTNAPYERLLLLAMVFVSAIHPPRRIAAFMGFILIALAAPFVYDGWDANAANASAATFVIWCGLAIGVNLLMSGVRAQRLAQAEEATEAREEATEARVEARVDTLTGLHNRRSFDEMLELEVSRARRLELPLTMAMVDIENFKEVNDRWSYAEGDRCLREVAAAVRSASREPDLCFRWGGDEFSLLLAGTSAEDAVVVGQRLENEVAAACRRPDHEPIRIRFAVAELRDEMPPAELVEMAGLALTAAKADAPR
jgi:diguanylate cyclase (GGDEF)-like protein